jgi:hypothetical protein
MTRQLTLLTGLLVLGLSCGCAARSRLEIATVQPDNSGQPCFGIKSTAMTREGRLTLQSVTVSTRGSAQAASRVMWSFMIEPRGDGLPLTDGRCISYGNTPPGMRLLTTSNPLQPGVVYVVSMMARVVDPNDSTQAYQRRFCVIPGPSAPRVHEVVWNASAGRWMSDLCSASDPSSEPTGGEAPVPSASSEAEAIR